VARIIREKKGEGLPMFLEGETEALDLNGLLGNVERMTGVNFL